MAYQDISIGSVAGDHSGDAGRTAWSKAKAMFLELFTYGSRLITNDTLTLSGTYGGPGTAGQNFIGVNSTLAGSVDNAVAFAPFFVQIHSTNFRKTVAPTILNAMQVDHYFGGAGTQGGFGGFGASVHMTAKSGNLAAGASQFYTAGTFAAFANANDGGTAGFGNGKGALFGTNPFAVLASGSTFWHNICGEEVNVAVETGASVDGITGIQVVQTSNHAIDASIASWGYVLSNQPGAAGWDYGVSFGNYDGYWPMKVTGTLIGSFTHAAGGGSAGTTTNGVDFSNVVFTGSAFKSTGFSVDGSGNTVVATVKITPVAVASLPAGSQGMRAFVTDANATAFASIVAGGGANPVPVYHDGTNWRIG